MQSTVSRDQKIGKVTQFAQRTSSRSRTESESLSEKKEEKQDIIETIEIKKDFEVEAKSSPSPPKKTRAFDNKTKEGISMRKTESPKRKSTTLSDTDKSSSDKSSTTVSMTKSLKDKKNSSLIPIKRGSTSPAKQPTGTPKKESVQKSTTTKSQIVSSSSTSSATISKSSKQVQRISTAASDKSTVISRKKKKTERVSRSDSQESLDKVQKKIDNVSASSMPSYRKKHVRTTTTAAKPQKSTTTKTQVDITIRSQSALHYANKDSITFEHGEISSSMPSSPSHVKRPGSSNGNNVITSEVFTRTVDSPKSLEVIFRQPESHTTRTRYVSDVDASFIETTDSSLSDSIALPSSTSEQDAEQKRKCKASPQSPTATTIPLELIEPKSSTKVVKTVAADITNVTTTTKKVSSSESDVITSNVVTVESESISPILEFQAVSPQRQKHKFTYEKKSTTTKGN
jgi:hypothetical protein